MTAQDMTGRWCRLYVLDGRLDVAVARTRPRLPRGARWIEAARWVD